MSSIRRLVFFGTPHFAVPTLKALVAAGRNVVAVVSQPDRPAGRGRKVQPTPVASCARAHGLSVLQPPSVRDEDFLRTLDELQPDVAVVVAFGQIFRQRLLELPRLGCINVHASLLPRWRGAAPIAAAIRAGDETTGVCTMQMERGLDSGPVFLCESTEIGDSETCGDLTRRLAELGARTLVATLQGVESGDLVGRAQDPEAVTLAPMLSREDSWIDWSRSADAIDRQIRAHDPWPGSRTQLGERELVIKRAKPLAEGHEAEIDAVGRAGTIVGARDGALLVECDSGTILALEEVQRPGRRALRGGDLWNGERLSGGERFVAPRL